MVETLLRGDNAETFRLESLPLYPVWMKDTPGGVKAERKVSDTAGGSGITGWTAKDSLRRCSKKKNVLERRERRQSVPPERAAVLENSRAKVQRPLQAGTGDMTMTAVPSAADERTTTALNVAGATTDPVAGGRREKKRRKNARRNPLSDGRKTNTAGGKKEKYPGGCGGCRYVRRNAAVF